MTLLTALQFFGTVSPPPGVAQYDTGAGGFGLISFASNIIRLITIIAGIWSLLNVIMAGFKYITAANDAKGIQDAWQSIYMSLIGMLIILSSYTIAAIVGYIFFGDATYIINPTLVGV